MGMLTRPNAIDPFHSARAMSLVRLLAPQLLFGFDPVVDVPAMFAAAMQKAVVSAHADVLLARLRAHGVGDGSFAVLSAVGRIARFRRHRQVGECGRCGVVHFASASLCHGGVFSFRVSSARVYHFKDSDEGNAYPIRSMVEFV